MMIAIIDFMVCFIKSLNGKEILMTQEIWSILETMNDYEKLYLTYLVQDCI